MTAVSIQAVINHPDMEGYKPLGYDKYLVISVGTGSPKKEMYSALDAAKWGLGNWMLNLKYNSNPLLSIILESSRDMVQYLNSVLFQAVESEDNYLKIDVDVLKKNEASMDLATPANLENLKKIGEEILSSSAMRMNLDTNLYERIPENVTNDQELKRFAKRLSNEWMLRNMATNDSSN